MYNQLLVAWNKCFCTALRQVSRLKDLCIRHLPGFPVISRLLLPNYGDEFVQDLHLFPFSPKPAMKSIVWNTKWLLRHLTAIYSVFFVPVYHTAHSAIRRIAFIVTYFTGCRNGSSRILPKILLTSFLHILVQWKNNLRSLPQYRQMYPVCHSSFLPWPAGHTEWVAYTLWSDP